MNCMATLKHISSKNSDYSAIEAYLIYQHDAFTGKQLLDEQGKPKLRESYILDTLACGDFSFAMACLLGTLIDLFPKNIRNCRFEADITDNELTFSYRLRPGVAQNMNACFLMKKMGIAVTD